jgi:phosphoribosyl-dephospho-CoA transferase
MTPLHRHQIAWLSRAGWQRLLARDWDAEALACLQHWAEQRLPAVVTRRSDPMDGEAIALGLCAPGRWRHRRLALHLARADVLYFDEFPRLGKVVAQLPPSARLQARQLATALQACCAVARVYGSHGWQHLTGMDHLRDGSDLDLWIGVHNAEQADAVAAALDAFAPPSCRLDGELVFHAGGAVAWREWQAWRSGRVQAVLVKRLQGAVMATSMEALEPCEAPA